MAGVATLELAPARPTVTDLIGMDWDQYLDQLDQQDDYDPLLCARLTKAMRLAPSIVVFNELLAGHDIPRSALDQKWAARYRM